MKVFMDGIRIHNQSLGALVNQVGMWQDLWTVWTPLPKASAPAASNQQAKSTVNDELQQELKKIQGLTRNLQSQQDRQANQFRFMTQQRKYPQYVGGKGTGADTRDRSRDRQPLHHDQKGRGRGRPTFRR